MIADVQTSHVYKTTQPVVVWGIGRPRTLPIGSTLWIASVRRTSLGTYLANGVHEAYLHCGSYFRGKWLADAIPMDRLSEIA